MKRNLIFILAVMVLNCPGCFDRSPKNNIFLGAKASVDEVDNFFHLCWIAYQGRMLFVSSEVPTYIISVILEILEERGVEFPPETEALNIFYGVYDYKEGRKLDTPHAGFQIQPYQQDDGDGSCWFLNNGEMKFDPIILEDGDVLSYLYLEPLKDSTMIRGVHLCPDHKYLRHLAIKATHGLADLLEK